ncbi:MAG: AMIN domain-containing protein, partial [Gemmatimonadales bacterium]
MKRIAPLAAALLVAAAPGPLPPLAVAGVGPDGEVRTVSVRPAAGSVEVVIELNGAVEVRDFTLRAPDRLVIDLVGARLRAPAAPYDGTNRGGVRNIRTAQFRPDVVRVVLELDALGDYQVRHADGQVRVRIGTDRTAFLAWSSA